MLNENSICRYKNKLEKGLNRVRRVENTLGKMRKIWYTGKYFEVFGVYIFLILAVMHFFKPIISLKI